MFNTLKKFIFNGKLANEKNEEWPALVYLEYDEYDPSVLNCKATLENFHSSFGDSGGLESNSRITGELSNGNQALIKCVDYSRLYWYRSGRVEVDLNVDAVLLGPSGDVPYDSGRFSYLITLLKAPSVEVHTGRESTYLGNIERKRKADDAISWEADIGNICIANYYELDKGKVGIQQADIQVEKSQVVISGRFTSPINVERSLARIEEGIKDVLTILSLINRRFIHWYEIDATISKGEEYQEILHVLKRRRIRSLQDSTQDPLFGQRELKSGRLFELLVSAYKNSMDKSAFERAITYLTASYERETLEAKLQAVYSAIEAIVNKLSKKKKIYPCLPKSQEKELLTRIESALDKFYEDRGMPKTGSYAEIKEKLQEIKRRPIGDRIIDVIDLNKVDCSDFWDLTLISLKDKIREMLARRNKLMHTAVVIDPSLLYADLIRLRAICERIVLSELGFNEPNRYFPVAYRELHSMYRSP